MSNLPPELIKALAIAPWTLPAAVGIWGLLQLVLFLLKQRSSPPAATADDAVLVQVVQQNTEAMSRLVDVLNRMERDQRESAKDTFDLLRDIRDRVRDLESAIPELQALIERLPAEFQAEIRSAVEQIIRAMPKTA